MPSKLPSPGRGEGPHAGQPFITAGRPLEKAEAALVLIHGRGASAESMLPLAEELGAGSWAVFAPQAARNSWYPQSFLAPLDANEPWLDSAIACLENLVTHILSAGLSSQRLALLGFSQGACLALEFAARHPRRYGAVIAFTGGLIGPPGTPRNYPGTMAGTLVFLGAGDPDVHVPFERVEESRDVLAHMGAVVDLRRYPGMAHTINADELDAARALLKKHGVAGRKVKDWKFLNQETMLMAAETTLPGPALAGLHHVTAICSDPQKNIDFYAGVLGLRLVKLTVNFDDPASYHLYYGDELGRPGTIMTFFAWPGAPRGRIGPPQATATAFAVPMGTIDTWAARLEERKIPAERRPSRFGEPVLAFTDSDGLALEIVAAIESTEPRGQAWAAGPVATAHAIFGFHSVTISEEGYESTAQLLTDTMGFQLIGSEQNRFRYRAGTNDGGLTGLVDLLCVPDARHGSMGAGVVHHVAFRTPDDANQKQWHEQLVSAGRNVSPVMDRTYFHSIYYREPGGVLFEIATGNPGFTADEAADRLGTKLQLPPWLESHRAEIQNAVPPVQLPTAKV